MYFKGKHEPDDGQEKAKRIGEKETKMKHLMILFLSYCRFDSIGKEYFSEGKKKRLDDGFTFQFRGLRIYAMAGSETFEPNQLLKPPQKNTDTIDEKWPRV